MDRMDVGTGQHCTFMALITGIATVKEQRPYPERSLIIAIFFCLADSIDVSLADVEEKSRAL